MRTFSPQAIKTLVPEEVYTDRQEFLDYFYEYALNAIGRRSMSTVLLGQRRMGKTEIFKRVFNRLFFEQDHTDPTAVVPIFYTFSDKGTDDLSFALNYVENFLRWYVAFRLRDPDVLSTFTDQKELLSWIEKYFPISPGFSFAIDLMYGLMKDGVTMPAQRAVMLPRTVSDRDDSTIIVFLDEFQNTRLPQDNFDIVWCFHESCRDVLIRLSRGDLLEYIELGGWFRTVDDPILLDFLKAWGKFEVEGQSAASVLQQTVKQYDRLQRRINDQKGYLAEVYLSQILWNGQRKAFPGRYFHCDHDVALPDRFYVIKQRLRLDAAGEHEAVGTVAEVGSK